MRLEEVANESGAVAHSSLDSCVSLSSTVCLLSPYAEENEFAIESHRIGDKTAIG